MYLAFVRSEKCYVTVDVLKVITRLGFLLLARYFLRWRPIRKGEENKMAKENVNVADELKDERQKTNLAQSAKETDKTQVIAGTDTDDEVIETTEENETQLPKIYVKRKRYTNKTDGKQYWEYVTSAMMRGSVSEVHFKASDVGGYEALEKLFGDDNKALELKVREERQYDEKTGWRKYYVYEVVFIDEIGFEWRYPLKTARTSDKAVMENYIRLLKFVAEQSKVKA